MCICNVFRFSPFDWLFRIFLQPHRRMFSYCGSYHSYSLVLRVPNRLPALPWSHQTLPSHNWKRIPTRILVSPSSMNGTRLCEATCSTHMCATYFITSSVCVPPKYLLCPSATPGCVQTTAEPLPSARWQMGLSVPGFSPHPSTHTHMYVPYKHVL